MTEAQLRQRPGPIKQKRLGKLFRIRFDRSGRTATDNLGCRSDPELTRKFEYLFWCVIDLRNAARCARFRSSARQTAEIRIRKSNQR